MHGGKDLVVGYWAEWVRSKGHAMGSQVTAASGAVSLMQTQENAKRQFQVQTPVAVGAQGGGGAGFCLRIFGARFRVHGGQRGGQPHADAWERCLCNAVQCSPCMSIGSCTWC